MIGTVSDSRRLRFWGGAAEVSNFWVIKYSLPVGWQNTCTFPSSSYVATNKCCLTRFSVDLNEGSVVEGRKARRSVFLNYAIIAVG